MIKTKLKSKIDYLNSLLTYYEVDSIQYNKIKRDIIFYKKSLNDLYTGSLND